MSKRFTDTEKWNKKFVRSLRPEYKLLWMFILDECNTAGIWDVDIEVAEIKTGVKLKEKEAVEIFSGKVLPIDNGTKWFVPAFIEFQYGELNESNRAHTKAILLLKKYNLPVDYSIDKTKIIDAIMKDKKRDSSLIKFVLLEKIGKAVIDEISFNELYNYI